MIRKIFAGFLLLFTLHLSLISSVFAEGEFSTSYNISYDVDASGITQVTENISLKNLTDRLFASEFSLSIGSTNLTEVTASDSQGPLPVEVKTEGNKTQINVKFTQQVAGINKEYPWTLRFKSKDFAQAQGKVWQVSVPKISSLNEVDNYNLTLSVPVSFGDPTTILPEPARFSESGGKLHYNFNKGQLTDGGILANFGKEQFFDFKMKYNLVNDRVLPVLYKVALPPNTTYQEVIISKIEPKPESVVVDEDGNYIGYFKLNGKQNLTVEVEGLSKLLINKNAKDNLLSPEQIKEYTSSDKYWDTENPIIKTKLQEIFKDQKTETNAQKAKLIHKFVASSLQYDNARLASEDYQRLGAVTALTNPQRALCSEFADLFVTMARAAGIPARMLAGYAYTSNTELRPLSLDDDVLHAWAEYYDPNLGWIMVDPTWENTTGGVDYFTKFDLNHFVLSIRGTSSDGPSPADNVDVKFSEAEFKPVFDTQISIESPDEIFAGLTNKMTIKISNSGNFLYPSSRLRVVTENMEVAGPTDVEIAQIPPAGNLEFEYDLRARSFFEQKTDVITVQVGDKILQKPVLIKPFFAYKAFSAIVLTLASVIIFAYIAIFVLHLKVFRHSAKQAN